MGNLVLTRRIGESLIITADEKNTYQIRVEGWRSGIVKLVVDFPNGNIRTANMKVGQFLKIADGNICVKADPKTRERIRVVLDFPEVYKIFRSELLK